MLCPSCRRQLSRGAAFCGACGAVRPGAAAPLELVLPDATRVPVTGEMVVGRAPGSTLQLDDPSVSRTHARILVDRNGAPWIEDAGSSHGTFLDGVALSAPVALRDGAHIRLGNQRLAVERRRDGAEAGRTIVVPAGASLLVSAVGAQAAEPAATRFGMRPRVRSGYALKRMDAEEGGKRYVLRDLRSGKFLRLSEHDAELFRMLDGSRSLSDLIGYAEQRHGAAGPARVARLLADLGERDFLAGVTAAGGDEQARPGRLRRLVGPRERAWTGVGKVFDRVYARGGWVLFTRPALVALVALAVAGIGVFGYLIGARYGTPFVVASKIGIGGLVFLGGRFAVVAVHELAHGLAMASYGRTVGKAGFKLLLIFPYAYVDTSEAWFEPRRRRIAVSAAGPLSDFALGAVFSICALVFAGTVREIFFQLAFAAYVGAFFNLNPFLDRDGYHILVDVLREPGLRQRAREQFERRLSGRGGRETDSPAFARYSIAGIFWGVAAVGFAVFMSVRYEPMMTALAPKTVVWIVLGTLWLALFVPVVWTVGKPLVARVRGPRAVG